MTPKTPITEKAKQFWIYGRCSTSHQMQGSDSLTVDAQVEKCKTYGDFQDWELGGIYKDLGKSGKKERDNFETCVDEVCKNKGVLVVYSLSRAFRNTKKLIELSERLNKAGAQIASIVEKIDTSSSIGIFYFQLIASLSELESNTVSDRTKSSLNHKRGLGLVYGKDARYGYRKSNGNIVEDKKEQIIIARCAELRGNGLTQRAITSKIEIEGYRNRAGNRFALSHIQKLLKAS